MLVPSITPIKLCCSEAKLLGFLGFDDLIVRVAQIRIRITPKIIGSNFIISYPFLILNSPFKWLSAFHIVYMNNMKDNFKENWLMLQTPLNRTKIPPDPP